MRGTAIMACVLPKTLRLAVVMAAVYAASIAFSLGTYAMPISASAAFRVTSKPTAVHYGYFYRCGYYCRSYLNYRPYFSYPYRLPPPVRLRP